MTSNLKNIIIVGLAVSIAILANGCASPKPYYPKNEVFNNGVTYRPTWDGYNVCKTNVDHPTAECMMKKNKDDIDGPIVKVLEPEIDVTMNSFIKNNSDITTLCNKVDRLKLLPDHDSPNSCKNYVSKKLDVGKYGTSGVNWDKQYEFGFIDKGKWLCANGRTLEAYQSGLIDKDTARKNLIALGQIIEAYEAKLIDKDTADLYLKQKQITDATRASQQQATAIKAAADRQESQNIQTMTNGLNGFTNQLNGMTNQMKQRNNSYQGFDASKGLNFKGYGY